MKKNQITLSAAFLFVAILLFGCKTSKKVAVLDIPNEQFAFIEFYQTVESEVLEGQTFPGPHIHGPTYTFSKELGTISALNSPINRDSLNILLGKGLVLRGAQGGGIKTELIPYESLPISDGLFTVQEISLEGLKVTWEDSPILLERDNPFVRTSTQVDTMEINSDLLIVKTTTSYQIVYHGFLNKEDLQLE